MGMKRQRGHSEKQKRLKPTGSFKKKKIMKLQEGTHTNSCRNSGVNSIVPTRRRSNNTQTQYVDFVGPPLS